jgi:hypothetical protein
MRTPWGRRITRRSAARALDRAGASGSPHVDQVLAATTAPPTNFELNGEADAVAMFRRANPGPVAAARTTPVTAVRSRTTKLLIATGAVVIAAGGGVAVAATTGALPGHTGDHPSHTSTHGPGSTAGPHSTATSNPTDGTAAGRSDARLCRAYQAIAANNPGKALSSPAFTGLAIRAGGRSSIAGYCTSLIGAPSSHAGSSMTPGSSGDPTAGSDPTPTSGTTNTHPTHPVHPTHPTHPVHPTQAANDTTKAHPTKTPKSPKS